MTQSVVLTAVMAADLKELTVKNESGRTLCFSVDTKMTHTAEGRRISAHVQSLPHKGSSKIQTRISSGFLSVWDQNTPGVHIFYRLNRKLQGDTIYTFTSDMVRTPLLSYVPK